MQNTPYREGSVCSAENDLQRKVNLEREVFHEFLKNTFQLLSESTDVIEKQGS